MSKAEKRACQYTGYCKNESYSDFLNGYHQAEEDNELTWEDIKNIDITLLNVDGECDLDEKEYYQEVLKRFKEKKNGN